MSMIDYIDLAALCDEAVGEYPANRLYCLVDHAGMPGLHRELIRSHRSWGSLFRGASDDVAVSAAPLLFPLDGGGDRAGSDFLRWVAQHGTFTSSLLLLSSPLELEALRNRLAFRLHAHISDEMNVLLRFFDPRVFESLMTVLDKEQRTAFLNPADCWWYCDRSGVLRRQSSSYATVDVELSLAAAQEFALLDASEIDQVGAQLQSMLPDAYLCIGAASRAAFLRRHMEAAGAVGIAATHEVALYCGLALLYGEEFAREPHWSALLSDVQTGSVPFVDAVAGQVQSHDGGIV